MYFFEGGGGGGGGGEGKDEKREVYAELEKMKQDPKAKISTLYPPSYSPQHT